MFHARRDFRCRAAKHYLNLDCRFFWWIIILLHHVPPPPFVLVARYLYDHCNRSVILLVFAKVKCFGVRGTEVSTHATEGSLTKKKNGCRNPFRGMHLNEGLEENFCPALCAGLVGTQLLCGTCLVNFSLAPSAQINPTPDLTRPRTRTPSLWGGSRSAGAVRRRSAISWRSSKKIPGGQKTGPDQ